MRVLLQKQGIHQKIHLNHGFFLLLFIEVSLVLFLLNLLLQLSECLVESLYFRHFCRQLLLQWAIFINEVFVSLQPSLCFSGKYLFELSVSKFFFVVSSQSIDQMVMLSLQIGNSLLIMLYHFFQLPPRGLRHFSCGWFLFFIGLALWAFHQGEWEISYFRKLFSLPDWCIETSWSFCNILCSLESLCPFSFLRFFAV